MIDANAIEQAAERIAPHVRVTPCVQLEPHAFGSPAHAHTQAGAAAAHRVLQAAGCLQSHPVQRGARRRRHRGVGRQPRRSSGLRRTPARPRRRDLRARADPGCEGGAPAPLRCARDADRRQLRRGLPGELRARNTNRRARGARLRSGRGACGSRNACARAGSAGGRARHHCCGGRRWRPDRRRRCVVCRTSQG